ncbi:transposable element Tc3 transposase [Trichonephila clavipes]|nr:transposable element Tc3 transposase [Trichonephila clavipes]
MESARYPLPPRKNHGTTPFRWCMIARLGDYTGLSRTELHVQIRTMMEKNILEQHVRLLGDAMRAEILFMDDNSRSHRAHIVNECLQFEDVTYMEWPAFSSDLNSIEHVRDMLG